MTTVAYCRVSTEDQAEEGFSIDGQIAKLTDYARLHDLGEPLVVTDPGASGKNLDRPGLQRLLELVEAGDVTHVLVWRLDRLGRSMKHLISVVADLEERGIGFRSLTENIDTTTPAGKLVFHIFGALAEFERELIRERTQAGLAAARARGRKGGRPTVMTVEKLKVAREMLDTGEHTAQTVAATIGVSRSSLYRALSSEATSDTLA